MSTLWLALGTAVALSPSILGTVQHVAREPWKAASFCALAILVAAVRTERNPRGPFAARQALWVLAAVGFQLVASATSWDAGHRVALALGVIGFLRTSGLASLGTSLWILPAIPAPTGLARLTSPALENALGQVASLAWPADQAPLALHHGDGGLVPMILGGAFGLALAWRARLGWPRTLAGAACGVAAGLLTQLGGLMVAGALQPSSGAALARTVLDLGPGLVMGGIGISLLLADPFARPLQESNGETS